MPACTYRIGDHGSNMGNERERREEGERHCVQESARDREDLWQQHDEYHDEFGISYE